MMPNMFFMYYMVEHFAGCMVEHVYYVCIYIYIRYIYIYAYSNI